MPRAPAKPPPPPRRGGLWAGLRAGARGTWRGLMTVMVGNPPRVIRKVQLRGEFIASAPMLCWILAFGLATQIRSLRGVPWAYYLVAAMAATFVLQFVFWLKVRRMRAHAANVNYRICPECGYSLANLAAEGTCPECGTAYSPDELEIVWKRK